MDATSTPWLQLDGAPQIDGLRFRRPRNDDAEYDELAEMIGEACKADTIPWHPSGSMLREDWTGDLEAFDPARDALVAEVDGRAVAVGGHWRVLRHGRPVYSLWGHAHPAWRRRGIGRAMLAEHLRAAQERGLALGDISPGDRVEVRSLAAETETGFQAILTAAGLVPVRWIFQLRRPTLDDIPDAPLPEGLELRPVERDQVRAVLLADDEAFRDHWEPRDFTEASMRSEMESKELRLDLWVVAWDGDEVVGSVQGWIWPEENEALGVERGWLDSISVRRPWRRRGVARAMTAEALRRLKAAGMEDAMLGVDAENPTGALGLYEGLGFEVDHRSRIFAWPTSE
jgi:mycothiol synthase